MLSRPGRPAAIVLGLAAALPGCGSPPPPLPVACTTGPTPVTQALSAAPGPVRLVGGTPISTCVERARTDTEIQQVGFLFITVADRLAVRAPTDPQAALELGYLVGAARRGASRTNGVAAQVRQRIESAAALRGAAPPALAALHRGIGAGQSSG